MKNYNYRILGSSIIEKTNCQTVKELSETIVKHWGGGTKIEYWSECGNYSSTICCANNGYRFYNDYQ